MEIAVLSELFNGYFENVNIEVTVWLYTVLLWIHDIVNSYLLTIE